MLRKILRRITKEEILKRLNGRKLTNFCLECGEKINLKNIYITRIGLIRKKCLICINKARDRKYLPIEQLEKLRNNDREYQREKRKIINKCDEVKKYFKKYPERKRAMDLVYKKLKKKEIKKEHCKICKRKDAQAHHEDYSKPLEVIWLCPIHHKKRHIEINNEA